MPLTRSEKDKLIAEYQGGLAVAPHAFLLGFKGISVPQVTELRNRVRATGGEYLVVKNTLALRAIDSTALAALEEHFVGPTAVVFTDHDPVALAKALTDYAKEVPALEFKAGMVERRAVAAGQIKEIAQLPSREQLIAKLLYLLQSPITRFASLLAALPRSLVVVLDQVSKKKEEGGGGAAGATEAPAATGGPGGSGAAGATAGTEPAAAPEAPQEAVAAAAAGTESPAVEAARQSEEIGGHRRAPTQTLERS
jgi:large subunit ribosomal protein L10